MSLSQSFREKSNTIMGGELVFCITRITKQCVVRGFVCYGKIIIFSIFVSIRSGVNFHPQLTRDLGQLMNPLRFQAKTLLRRHQTCSCNCLSLCKIRQTIKAFMKDGPSTTIGLHVTVHLKTGFVCWVDCAHSTFLEADSKELCAISG